MSDDQMYPTIYRESFENILQLTLMLARLALNNGGNLSTTVGSDKEKAS